MMQKLIFYFACQVKHICWEVTCFFCNCTLIDQCVLQGGAMSCNCTGSGFSGLYCETNIDDCDPNPCLTGECIDGINNYTCVCGPERTGQNCETDPCIEGADVVATYTIDASNTPQAITSPGYPELWYCKGLNLRWVIACPNVNLVELKFTDFVTEDFYDWVSFTNGECTSTYCFGGFGADFDGNTDPDYEFQYLGGYYYQPDIAANVNETYVSSSSVATVYFNTGSCCYGGRGWSLNYRCI